MYSRKGRWVARIKKKQLTLVLELLLLWVMCSPLIRGCFPRKVKWNVYVYLGCLSANPEPLCLSQFLCHLNERVGLGLEWLSHGHTPSSCLAVPWGSHPWQGGSRKPGAPLAAAPFCLCVAVHRSKLCYPTVETQQYLVLSQVMTGTSCAWFK